MSGKRPSQSRGGSVPDGRYGPTGRDLRKKGRRRKARWIAFTVMVIILLGLVAFITYYNLGPKPIEANRTTFNKLPGNAMEMTMRVHRDEPDRASVCVVRVRSKNGLETGRREVLVPPGQDSVSTVIQSTRPPVTASVVGCSYNIPAYLSTGERPKE